MVYIPQDKAIVFYPQRPGYELILSPDTHLTEKLPVNLCAEISRIECKPLGDIFEEYSPSKCVFIISPPEQKDSCVINSTHFNTSICPKILARYRFWSEDDKERKDGSELGSIREYGEKTEYINLGSPGRKHFEFQFVCENSNDPVDSNFFRNNFTENIAYPTLSNGIYVTPTSEAKQQRITKIYQFIVALFALFGIFPATFYLRKLWRGR